jgi:hypothetical protein
MQTFVRKVLSSIVTGVTVCSLPVFAQSGVDRDVLALDQGIADAVVRGDTAYVDSMTAADFVMVHGDAWTRGGQPLLVDDKERLLQRVASQYYDVLDFDSVQAELHRDVAITHGRYVAHTTGDNDPNRAWFSVRYERVYARRDGSWQYLSHRTVHGPIFGASRESVVDDIGQSSPPTNAVTGSAASPPGGDEVLALERALGAAVARPSSVLRSSDRGRFRDAAWRRLDDRWAGSARRRQDEFHGACGEQFLRRSRVRPTSRGVAR